MGLFSRQLTSADKSTEIPATPHLDSERSWECICTAINNIKDDSCWNCKILKAISDRKIEQRNLQKFERLEAERKDIINEIPIESIYVVSTSVLPPLARYKLIGLVTFQSTLDTGIFSEFGSDMANIFGTESKIMNKKMGKSMEKCLAAMKRLAFERGANAVIDANFEFTTNSRDATTVAAHGTAVYIENIDEVFITTG